MAEAETKPDIDEGIVNCPICFEQFTKPKSLPCLHTFCVQCLSTYIAKCADKEGVRSSGFSCPICRAATIPPKPQDDSKMWAEQFPTNGLILNVLELLNFRKKETTCDPCRKRSKGNIKAESWCRDCKVYLCAECLEFHNSFLQSHSLVSVESALLCPTTVADNHAGFCPEHEEKLDMFCCDDQILACGKCISIEHRRCDKVVTAKGYARELQSTEKIFNTNKELENRLLEISRITVKKQLQLKGLENHKDTLAKSVSKFKSEMVEIFEKMEEKCINELTAIYKEDEDHIQIELEECNLIKKSIEYSKNMQRTAEICGCSDQIVSTTLQTISDNETFKQKISNIEKNDELTYELDIHKSMHKLRQDAVSCGGMNICRKSNRIDMRKCNAKQIHSFNAKMVSENKCRLTGVLYTVDSKIVLCDEANKKVKLFNEDGTLLSHLSLKNKPFDLCCMEANRLIVSQMDLAVIHIEGDSLKFSSTIKTANRGFGIGYVDEHIFITSPRCNPPSLELLEPTGCVKRTISDCEGETVTGNIWHLSINNVTKEVIVTVHTNGEFSELLFFTYDGESKRRLKISDSKGLRGIDVDFQGNIYVCGTKSSNIIQLSPDGSASRILLSATDDFGDPCAISFVGEKFVVTEDYGKNCDLVRTFVMK